MKINRKNALYISSAVLAAIILFIWLFGLYPEISVNGKWISKKYIKTELDAINYVAQNYQTAPSQNLSNLSEEKEIKRLILEKIIENVLVARAVSENPGLAAIADKKAGAFIDNFKNQDYETKDINQITRALYGRNFNQTKEQIFLPQARIEAVKESLGIAAVPTSTEQEAADAEKLEGFLKDLKQKANIKFYFIPFDWNKAGLLVLPK